MVSKNSNKTFGNISQRVLFSYLQQLSPITPDITDHLSSTEHTEMQISQKELRDFFLNFYTSAYTYPELFGLPIKPDVFMVPGMSKEDKAGIAKQFKKPRVTMEFGLAFLALIGNKSTLDNRHIHLHKQDYSSFFNKSPRVKRKFIKGMETVGLLVREKENMVVLENIQYPNIMLSLLALAKACAQYENDRIGKFILSRCDFKVLKPDYVPSVIDLLKTVLPQEELENAVEIHQNLSEMSYQPTLNIGGIHEWRIQYQGNRKIKSTPFFEFEYDERQEKQLAMRVKCASANRLVPLLEDQPESLQEDFFHHAHNCAGSSCGWCKTRKALGPSVIKYGGEKRTICWWMQRHFDKADGASVDLVRQYARFHEALVT